MKAEGSALTIFVCTSHEGAQWSFEKDKGGWLFDRFQSVW